MTPVDFIESTIAGALATHHPYHWIVIAVKWVTIHVAVIWGSIKSYSWLAKIVNVFCDWFCDLIISLWRK
jgi:hypothetical protein